MIVSSVDVVGAAAYKRYQHMYTTLLLQPCYRCFRLEQEQLFNLFRYFDHTIRNVRVEFTMVGKSHSV